MTEKKHIFTNKRRKEYVDEKPHYVRVATDTYEPEKKSRVSSLKVNSFDTLREKLMDRMLSILKQIVGLENIQKYFRIDRRTLSYLIPLSKDENHLIIFHLTERKWCSTWSKAKEHIDAALNSAKRMYAHELRKAKNVTLMLIGDNYSSKLRHLRVERYARKKVQQLYLGKGSVKTIECKSSDWFTKFSQMVSTLYEKRLSGIFNKFRAIRAKPYGDVESFIKRLKMLKECIIAIFEKGLPRSSVLRIMANYA